MGFIAKCHSELIAICDYTKRAREFDEDKDGVLLRNLGRLAIDEIPRLIAEVKLATSAQVDAQAGLLHWRDRYGAVQSRNDTLRDENAKLKCEIERLKRKTE